MPSADYALFIKEGVPTLVLLGDEENFEKEVPKRGDQIIWSGLDPSAR